MPASERWGAVFEKGPEANEAGQLAMKDGGRGEQKGGDEGEDAVPERGGEGVMRRGRRHERWLACVERVEVSGLQGHGGGSFAEGNLPAWKEAKGDSGQKAEGGREDVVPAESLFGFGLLGKFANLGCLVCARKLSPTEKGVYADAEDGGSGENAAHEKEGRNEPLGNTGEVSGVGGGGFSAGGKEPGSGS